MDDGTEIRVTESNCEGSLRSENASVVDHVTVEDAFENDGNPDCELVSVDAVKSRAPDVSQFCHFDCEDASCTL